MNDADADGDGVPDVLDVCPFDKEVSEFNFSKSQLLDFSSLRSAPKHGLFKSTMLIISVDQNSMSSQNDSELERNKSNTRS